MASTFENFDITVLRTGIERRFKLLIQYPGVQPERGRTVECELPPTYDDLLTAASPDRQRRWRRVESDLIGDENLVCYAANLDALKDIGDRLFQTLLQGELAGEYGVVADRVARDGGHLRLRINLTDAPELSRVPWEALYRKRNEVLLAISASTPVVRLLDSPTPADATPITAPVRLLVVTAVPRRDLDVDAELANIGRRTERLQSANRAVPFDVRILTGATRTTLFHSVREFRPHILHYIGHGSFENGSGWIHLHDSDDPAVADSIDAETLRDMLAGHRPKLVVLNTCEGGMASEIDSFSGMAHALIQRNVPYVVAMQFPISDEAAITFSDVLYADLATGAPIDVAVTNARNAIRLLKDPLAQVELITPVLYTSGSVDRLIDPSTTTAAAPNASALKPRSARRWIWIAAGGVLVALMAAAYLANVYLSAGAGPYEAQVDRAPSMSSNPSDDDMMSANAVVPDLDDPGPSATPVRPDMRPSHTADRDAGVVVVRRPARPRAGGTPVGRPVRDRQPARATAPRPQPNRSPAATVLVGQPVAGLPGARWADANDDGSVDGYVLGGNYHSLPTPEAALGDPWRPGLYRMIIGDRDPIVSAVRPGSDAPIEWPQLLVPAWINLHEGELSDTARLAGLRSDARVRSAAGDPQLLLRITGRAGTGYEQRLEVAGLAAAALGAGLAPDQAAVDAVADGRGHVQSSDAGVYAEMSLRIVEAEEVHFPFDGSQVMPAEEPRLQAVASWLEDHPAAAIQLRAHTDATGSRSYNEGLAGRRAEAVRQVLAELGVNEKRIGIMIVGEGMPAPGRAAGAAEDRRVELIIAPPPSTTGSSDQDSRK